MTVTKAAIEVSGLTKSYGGNAVLDGVDLTVPEGSVYALLGPNGAGKTTIVNILSTLLAPDDGTIRSPASTCGGSRPGCAPPSASPASSQRSTSCSRAARTCG